MDFLLAFVNDVQSGAHNFGQISQTVHDFFGKEFIKLIETLVECPFDLALPTYVSDTVLYIAILIEVRPIFRL